MLNLTTMTKLKSDEVVKKGEKVGFIKLRFFRPFPSEELREALKNIKAIGVFDRSLSYGSSGQVFTEVRNALYEIKKPILNFIAGLGGRDIREIDLKFMLDKLQEIEGKETIKDPLIFVNTRGVTA